MVAGLVADVGLRPVRVGDRARLDIVENLAALWFAPVFQQRRSRHLAFKLLGG